MKKIRVTEAERVSEGRLKNRNRQWRIIPGPREEGGDIPAVKIGNMSGGSERYMSEARRRTAKYKCRVQGCCWKEWTWGAIRRHVKNCHTLKESKTWKILQGMTRADFMVPTKVTLTQAFETWGAAEADKLRRQQHRKQQASPHA